MQRYVKPFRLIVSVIVLAVVAYLFIDTGKKALPAWFQCFIWLQFIPSLIKFVQSIGHGLSVVAFGFIVVIILTLLLGRVYCSFICPLGIFQDVVSRFSKALLNIRKKKFRFFFSPPKSWLRYSILVIFALSFFTGSVFFDLLEPYSIFGRFISHLLRPIVIADIKIDLYTLIIPVLTLALVIGLSVWKGRLYCNTVCPVGTLLGLMSKASLYKIRFNRSVCKQCGKCMFVCKSQCIDVKNMQVDFSRCVGCGNCLKSCDYNAFLYSRATADNPKIREEIAVSKRHFIFNGALFIATLGGLITFKSFTKNFRHFRKRELDPKCVRERGIGRGQLEVLPAHAVSPPGSFSLSHFTGACTACNMCVNACPKGVLKFSLFEHGISGVMQPFMDYYASFCDHECTKCGEVCPSGAILPLSVKEKQITQIGVSRFEKQNCVIYINERTCGNCAVHCPTQAIRMVPYKDGLTLPEITPDVCIGCGACEWACPVTPYKAIVIDGNSEHRILRT